MSERPLGQEAALTIGAFIRHNLQYNENKYLSDAILNVDNDALNVYTVPRLMSLFAPSGPSAIAPIWPVMIPGGCGYEQDYRN